MLVRNKIMSLLAVLKNKKVAFRVLRVFLIRKIRVSKNPRAKRIVIIRLKKLIRKIRKLKNKRLILKNKRA